MTLLFYIYYRYNLNTYAFYSAVALLGIHLAGGNIMTPEIYLYQIKIINLPFDKIVHVFGSFALTWLIASLVQNVLKPKTKKGVIFLIIISIGLSLGTLGEIVEFIGTLMISQTIVGDYANNAGDLVANLIGAIMASIVAINQKNQR